MCGTEGATAAVRDIDTESNSTIHSDADIATMPTLKLTERLFRQVVSVHPVSVNGKTPTLDDVRAVIETDYEAADDIWKLTAPKKVVQRLAYNKNCLYISVITYLVSTTKACLFTDWRISAATKQAQHCYEFAELVRDLYKHVKPFLIG